MTGSTATAPAVSQYCTFLADGLLFGVAVENVQEVLRYQQMTAVPRASQAVTGLINLRGQIVPAIDLRHRLGLPDRQAGASAGAAASAAGAADADATEVALPMNVVVRSRNEVVSLLVDDIGDVIDTGPAAVGPVPPTLPQTLRSAVTGVISLPDAILLVLDADAAGDFCTTADGSAGAPHPLPLH